MIGGRHTVPCLVFTDSDTFSKVGGHLTRFWPALGVLSTRYWLEALMGGWSPGTGNPRHSRQVL